VWHASVAARGLPYGRSALEAIAERELDGLGDASLGEWREWTGRAFHLRRRLSLTEAQSVGPVVDIRRTPEARERARALGKMLRYVPEEVLADEVG
jgi:hypothetical protein